MNHQKLMLNAINDLTTNTSSSFKYKVELLGDPVLDGAIAKKKCKSCRTIKVFK